MNFTTKKQLKAEIDKLKVVAATGAARIARLEKAVDELAALTGLKWFDDKAQWRKPDEATADSPSARQ